jgi:hypothetical protein
MDTHSPIASKSAIAAGIIALMSLATPVIADAQQTYPPPGAQSYPPQQSYPGAQTSPPQQSYPGSQTYPPQPSSPGGQPYPGQQTYPYGGTQSAPYGTYPGGTPLATSGAGSTFRNLFATTVAAVLMSTGSGAAVGLGRAVTGSILGWFSRKSQRFQGLTAANGMAPAYADATMQSPSLGTAGAPGFNALPPAPAYPQATAPYAPGSTYPSATGPAAVSAPDVGSSSAASAVTGAVTTIMPPQPAGSAAPGLYAGLAYEVHVIDPSGASSLVDPGTYVFHSGDKFLVHFRPSLPGQMEVANVNASGKWTKIDTAQMAAGQLTTLGPYQFTGDTGDESLHFVLTACSTPDLLTRTRDIVNVAAGTGSGPAIQLAACGTTTRDVLQTRDIQKVATEGTTSFALDPVASTEITSGQLAPREFTIVFHHR